MPVRGDQKGDSVSAGGRIRPREKAVDALSWSLMPHRWSKWKVSEKIGVDIAARVRPAAARFAEQPAIRFMNCRRASMRDQHQLSSGVEEDGG